MITTEIEGGALLGDRYRVLRRLGRGGMATVFLAEDERLGREVAIKRLRTDAAEDALRRFRREARLGAALNHPNFVSVYDSLASDEGVMIVMEYVPGRSLEDMVQRGRTAPEEALPILGAAADALDHAHDRGVVHRDIKPSNILVRDDGTVKIADLGIAKALDTTQITAEGKVVGTLPFMAPERMRGRGAGGAESDIYSLAAVALELLSGRRLESERSDDGMPEPIVPADHWPTGPPGALAALKRGLAEDPAARPISATDLVAQVEAGLTADVTRPTQALDTLPELRRTAPAVAPAGHARQGGGRTQIVLAVVAVAAIALVVGAVALGGGSGSDPAKVAKTGPGKAHGSEKAGDASPSGGGESGSAPSPAPAAASSSTASQSAAPVASGDGAALNQQGFALINEGRPEEAVPILREAVGAYPAGSTDLGYAYALFNLGHALRLSGHPDEAIQILERRLEIPDQQGTVAAELARARAEAGE